jgi:hypothetical protein
MKISKKVIILVMSSSNPIYQELEISIKETWFNYRNDDVEIIFYKDNQNLIDKKDYSVLDGFDLILPCNDGFYTLGQKTIMAFEWVKKNYEFDYLYRSNLGAFVDIENLLYFLKDKPKDKFYCGIIGRDTYYLRKEVKFASGSGYFLSKDLVNIVCDNKDMWLHNVVDDVALGELLSKFQIEVNNNAIRKNICDDKVFYQLGDKETDNIDDSEVYHIRLRSTNRKIDIENMKNIYEKYK